MKINNKVFDVLEKTSKHYYTLIISTKAKFSNNAQVLKRDFNLNDEQLKKVCILPHTVSFEPYVRAFCVVRFVFFVMEKCLKLNAAKKFFEILSGSEFVAFLGCGNEVEAFAKNRFFSI